jgi:membrane fusion protein, multidrug efflux system
MNRMKMYNKFQGKYVALLLVLGIVVAGCTLEGKPASENIEEEVLITVKTATVRRAVASYTLNLPGELAPFEEVMLYPKVSGFVQQIFVDRGSRVIKGQLLARLDAPEITQQYAAAAAKQREVLERLQYSQQSYNRFLNASKSEGAVAAIELEQAKAELMTDSASYQSLKAEMGAAKQLAAYLEIRAPFAGVISGRTVSPGALVGANEKPLFALAQQDDLRLTIAIPEKHAQALSDSTEIEYRISNYPNETFHAKISRSSGVLDKKLRSLMVEFDIKNKDRKLKGGEYIQAEVSLRRNTPSLWVPSTSIVNVPSGMFLLKVQRDTIRRVAVTQGIRKDSLTEVYGNLAADDLIVARGTEELREGTRVITK